MDVVFKAQRGFVQQLGCHRQIDPGAIQVAMSEKGGEDRQQPLHVSALAVPEVSRWTANEWRSECTQGA